MMEGLVNAGPSFRASHIDSVSADFDGRCLVPRFGALDHDGLVAAGALGASISRVLLVLVGRATCLTCLTPLQDVDL